MYPLKFEPILKQTLWGGDKIIPFKHLNSDLKGVGESWEISGVEDNESVVANGPDKGLTLADMVRKYREELVGEANYARFGNKFPLLIKFIDAKQDLSIQVHPADDLAKKRHNSMGKTEMWYIVRTEPGASLCQGFYADFSADGYTQRLADGQLLNHLSRHETHPGDCFFIPAGRIHSIGAGNFLVEIQQSSNDTFRVYDFDRTDSQGNKRELHVAQAREALDYKAYPEYRTNYTLRPNGLTPLVRCEQFTTRLYELTEAVKADYAFIDSFIILITFEGEALLRYDEGEIKLCAGQTVMFPATTTGVEIIPGTQGFKALETFC